jgi:hypothetical protein
MSFLVLNLNLTKQLWKVNDIQTSIYIYFKPFLCLLYLQGVLIFDIITFQIFFPLIASSFSIDTDWNVVYYVVNKPDWKYREKSFLYKLISEFFCLKSKCNSSVN